jgi:hypothetical protein
VKFSKDESSADSEKPPQWLVAKRRFFSQRRATRQETPGKILRTLRESFRLSQQKLVTLYLKLTGPWTRMDWILGLDNIFILLYCIERTFNR